ncbi:hypothetical protein SLS62_000858 [Diatrype stigma]|uniref:histone acetyltransferase n=1 Tax=Diatrype stigma TaxID=117547 RepID=A0AAN9YSF5_9PEZI
MSKELSRVLPKGTNFEAYHLSTPPTVTDALFHPPAQESTLESEEPRPTKPLRTYCEKHFLALSIDAEKHKPESHGQVLAFGLEIYIYTTSYSTTIFVAKADSTGYLSLLDIPKGTPSPIREVTVAFIAFLISTRRRPFKKVVVNLFARAQSQYLFPGSVKNGGKHVLDDRGLVKWWCRVLNALVGGSDINGINKAREDWFSIYGYLVVPGLDEYEARSFLPRSNTNEMTWRLGDPLRQMSPYMAHPGLYGDWIPPRCLIPTYPDDPKARFIEELEEATPTKTKLLKGWTTSRTLDEFWEMMAFRQECSSGRLTGFIWVVFDAKSPPRSTARPDATALPTPTASFNASDVPLPATLAPSELCYTAPGPPDTIRSELIALRRKRAKKGLRGRIVPRQPQIKTHNRTKFPDRISTRYYYWPEAGRGQVVLDESGYNRAVELLLHLEFAKLDVAITSTARWVNEVNVGAKWGLEIVGLREKPVQSSTSSSNTGGAVNDLSGMVQRKRPAENVAVNTLGAGLVRKKAKTTDDDDDTSASRQQAAQPQVNVLGGGLVRKKPKPAETKETEA